MRMAMRSLAVGAALAMATTGRADVMVTDDLWDVSQGTTIAGHSGVVAASDARNMLGYNNGSSEGVSLLFDDYKSDGALHYVEWQTASPVMIESFNIVAAHDMGYPDRRAFYRFDLFGWSGSGWESLYDSADTASPYGGGAHYTDAHFYELKADVSTVMTSQLFRAEFIQRGDANPSARGPRVLELDGFGSVVPEPGAVGLLALGAAGLLAIVRRRGGWGAH